MAKADPKSASSQKYAMYRAGMVAYTTERLTNLQRLVEMRAAAPGGNRARGNGAGHSVRGQRPTCPPGPPEGSGLTRSPRSTG